jgi:hypothetical protein
MIGLAYPLLFINKDLNHEKVYSNGSRHFLRGGSPFGV